MEINNPLVTIEMENGGVIKLELLPNIAPNSVNNFISLIKKGYYDGLIFHRVISGYTIAGEFTMNGFTNNLKHERGVISMARAMNPNSAGSQFFIMHQDSPHLDGQYASFGRVLEGMDIVDQIAGTETTFGDKPVVEQKIKKVTVDTFSVDYPEPKTV